MNGTDFLKTAAEILRENPLFKDQDLSETSVIYNTTLLPFALLTKPVADLNAYTLKSMKLDQMTDSQLDDFAAGYFVERRQTNVAVIDVTIYLKNEAAAIEPLIIYTTDEFRTASNEVFRPVTNYVFAYASLSLDETKTYRVANITVTGNALNVAENSIKTFTNSHPKIDHVTNLRPSSSPITRETNAELIKTIQRSIAERGNAKADSICTNLKNAFPYIVDVLPIGYGAQEMQRDIAVAAKSWSGHFGGNTDVYVRTTAAPATANIKGATKVAGVGYTFILRRYKGFDWNAIDTQAPQPNCLTPWLPLPTQDLPAAPVLYIDWAKTTVTNTSIKLGDNGIPQYSIEVMPDPSEKSYGKNYRYSVYEHLRVTIHTTSTANNTEDVMLQYFTLKGIEDIQAYLDRNRDIGSSVIAKSFIPVRVKKLVIVYKQQYSIDEASWRMTLANIINAWNLEEPISFTTLLSKFEAPVRISEIWSDSAGNMPYELGPNGSIIKARASAGSCPCYATLFMDQIDGSQQYYLSTQQLAPVTSFGLSATQRTCRYFIEPENIEFVKGSW